MCSTTYEHQCIKLSTPLGTSGPKYTYILFTIFFQCKKEILITIFYGLYSDLDSQICGFRALVIHTT